MRRAIDHVHVNVFEIPTVVQAETDGTASWDSTTLVLVQLGAAGAMGLGYSYVHSAAAKLIEDLLAPCVRGEDPFAIPQLQTRMLHVIRNHGREGIGACAIAAIDIALWDLKARLIGVSVSELLGRARRDVPVYASGGFTSTPLDALAREVAGYVEHGHERVKIKIGRPVEYAYERARVAREAIGRRVDLMVDGNGAFSRKEAISLADRLRELDVSYFEEPVSSDDLDGLRLVRDSTQLSVAAGEYGYDAAYFQRMLRSDAVDILQADATRCLGFSGFLQADALCDAASMPLSAHCAPALHVHVACASRRLIHVENFFDHARIESMLFDGAPRVIDGTLTCRWEELGLGLRLRPREAARFAA